ncbi:MAG: gliding motility-associated C-terminal domain-containing protein [Bacteroidia bacterium]|nr:gliding motility-associated C-terminal domain-containing protein [Bacteroidia bacterium]
MVEVITALRKGAVISLTLLYVFSGVRAQNKSGNWSVSKPFRQSAFIENKDQFRGQNGLPEVPVQFGISNDGVDIFLSKNGITYRHFEKVSKDYSGTPTGKRLKGQTKWEAVPHYVHVRFAGANPNCIATPEQALAWYYTYSHPDDDNKGLKCSAFKKVIYKNLYPGIDIEYTVHEQGGIKYSFIVHPGADPSVIRLEYSGEVDQLELENGNLLIRSAGVGNITDHQPVSFMQSGNTPVSSSYVLSGNSITFKLGKYNTAGTLIIDPWTSPTAFTGFQGAYEVDYDQNGNQWVYGGAYPWQVIKYNNAGVQQWVFTCNAFNPTWSYYFGDFCVDPVSGSAYMVESINTGIGGEIIKINTNGILVIVFPGNVMLEEMWRIAYNGCTDKLVIAGGGVSQTNQACLIDTSLTSGFAAFNVCSTNEIAHDMCYLALDNANQAYMHTTNWGNPALNNRLLKMPANTLTPTTWMVATNYTYQEGGNLTYINGGGSQSNGHNGIAVSPNFIYTCDGADLKKWDKTTGALILSVNIAPTPRTCGGMAVDNCDNIFIGVQNNIRVYDVNLTLQQTIPATAVVYDVRLNGSLIHVSGNNFAQTITNPITCNQSLNLTVTSTGSSCSSNSGTATVVVTGGSGPYSYVWNPGGQTTATATGLSSGTYTVTVTDASCIALVQTATVTVTNSGGLTVTTQQNNLACASSTNGSATVTVTGGQSPYTYAWNPSGQTTATATGLGPGTYTCTITDASGCTVTQTFTITAPPALANTTATTPANCGSNNGSASVTASGGTGPYTYAWSSGGTAATETGLSAGTYTVTVTDANGCTMTATVTVTSLGGGPTVAIASQTNPSCSNSSNGTATVNVTTGNAPYTYAWSPGGGTAATGTGLAAGTYTVTVTDANGCIATITVTVTAPPPVTATTSNVPANCNSSDGSASVTAGGGTGPYTYSWSSGGTGSTETGLASGTYTVTITDANGCTLTATANVPVLNGPTAIASGNTIIMAGNSTNLTATGGGNYQWSPASGLSCTTCPNPVATPSVTTQYCVIVTDASGCSDSACVYVVVEYPCPTAADFTVPNAFSPNKDGKNDIFILQGLGLCLVEFKMVIYDRWGEKVWETENVNTGWDGTFKGKPLDPQVFVYYISAKFLNNNEEFIKKGNVTLMR